MSKKKTIVFHAGDARNIEFAVYDEDPLDPGEPDLLQPVDLTGATAIRFAIADDVTTAAHFTKTLGDGITVVTGSESVDNLVRVALAKGDTSGLAPGRKYYELDITLGGDDFTSRHGQFTLSASLLK